MSIADVLRTAVQANIDRAGQHLFAIFGDGDAPGFIYTIGNANHALPELLLIGDFSPQSVAPILDVVGRRMRETGQFPLEELDVGATYPVRTRLAGERAKSEYTLQVGEYLGHEEYAVVQLLLADPAGRYPGEQGCDPRYDVPLA